MKKKLFLLLTAILVFCTTTKAQNYDFSAVSPNGQTLWYKINPDSVSVSLTFPGDCEEWWYCDHYLINSGYHAPAGNLIIPDTVYYGSNAYAVTAMACGALYSCDSLISLHIPKTMIDVGCGIRASGLQNITVDPENPVYDSRNNCNAIVHTATNTLVKGAYNTIIPNTVTIIGNNAFENATVPITFDIPSWITSIGESAFCGCKGLKNVNIPAGLTNIPSECFFSCYDLENITFPTSLRSIGYRALCNDHNLTSITLPDSLKYIEMGAFYATGITSIYIPASVTTINGNNERPFRDDTNLVSIIVDEGNTVYDSRNGCNAIIETATNTLIVACKTTVIPPSVRRIGGAAFAGIPLPEIFVIPDSVESIDQWAFADLWPISKIILGSSITEINSDMFGYGMPSSLQSIELRSTIPPTIIPGWYEPNHLNIPADFPIHVPCGTTASYQSDPGWSYFTNFIESTVVTVATQDNIGGIVNVIQSPSCTDSTAIVEAVAWQGYRFSNWSDSDTTNPRTISTIGDTTLTAVFVEDRVIVTATDNLGLNNCVTGGGLYGRNQAVTMRVSAPAGYAFLGWDNGATSNPYQFIASTDTTITAIFLQYTQPDTVTLHDTTYVNVHDTTYIDVHDTTVVDNYIYDTTTVYDTVTLTEYVHDTTIIADTLYLTEYVHDTIVVDNYIHDTIVNTEYVYQTDTIVVDNYIYDTIVNTEYVYQTDTVVVDNYIYDTIVNTEYVYQIDTVVVDNYVTDTLIVTDTLVVDNYLTDTLYLWDTLYLTDTVYIHDTVYVYDSVGVDDVSTVNYTVYATGTQIVVEGDFVGNVALYDLYGRMLAVKRNEFGTIRFDVAASGAYLIKVGDHPARKIVVVR